MLSLVFRSLLPLSRTLSISLSLSRARSETATSVLHFKLNLTFLPLSIVFACPAHVTINSVFCAPLLAHTQLRHDLVTCMREHMQVAKIFCNELLKSGTTTALTFCTVHKESVDALFTAAQERFFVFIHRLAFQI